MSDQELSTIRRLAEKHADAFTEPSMRWLVFNSDKNGLDEAGAIVRVPGSRRILIDVRKFFNWLRSNDSKRGRARGGSSTSGAAPALAAPRTE